MARAGVIRDYVNSSQEVYSEFIRLPLIAQRERRSIFEQG